MMVVHKVSGLHCALQFLENKLCPPCYLSSVCPKLGREDKLATYFLPDDQDKVLSDKEFLKSPKDRAADRAFRSL